MIADAPEAAKAFVDEAISYYTDEERGSFSPTISSFSFSFSSTSTTATDATFGSSPS